MNRSAPGIRWALPVAVRGPSSHFGGTSTAAGLGRVDPPLPRGWTRVADVDLSDLLPKVPLEELLMREALGAPGQPPVEVGLQGPRFANPRGVPVGNLRLALLRALGGVAYPASREKVLDAARPWLRSSPQLAADLEALPPGDYGGEMDVICELELARRHSAGGGNPGGSSAAT